MQIRETMPLQEIKEKIEKPDGSPAKVIFEQMQHKYFDPYEFEALTAWQNIGETDRQKFFNTLRSFSLADMMRAVSPKPYINGQVNPHLKEFLASSGTSGIGGAYYLIPVKLWDQMQQEAVHTDKVADLSKAILGPEALPGTTLKVDIAVDGTYIFNESSSGAIAATETIKTTQATLDFTPIYTINFRIGNDLIEDSKFDLISMHVSEAGRQAGEKATDLAFTVLHAATDGDGTRNAITGDQAYTEWYTDGASHTVEEAIMANIADGYVPDTYAVPHKAYLYNIKGTAGAQYNEAQEQDRWLTRGYPTQLGGMNIVWIDTDTAVAAAAKSVVFTKEYALLTGRKRWLRVENYSEPVKDLTGAVVSFRQDSITLYNDAIAPYAESS